MGWTEDCTTLTGRMRCPLCVRHITEAILINLQSWENTREAQIRAGYQRPGFKSYTCHSTSKPLLLLGLSFPTCGVKEQRYIRDGKRRAPRPSHSLAVLPASITNRPQCSFLRKPEAASEAFSTQCSEQPLIKKICVHPGKCLNRTVSESL